MVRFKTCKTVIHLLLDAKTVETVYKTSTLGNLNIGYEDMYLTINCNYLTKHTFWVWLNVYLNSTKMLISFLKLPNTLF